MVRRSIEAAIAIAAAFFAGGCSSREPASAPPDPASIDGVAQAANAGAADVRGVLASLPARMGESYALMEVSRSRHRASLDHPRVILFGTDARFLVAVSSTPDDPLHEVVEMAELDEGSGLWRFRALDMGAKPPRLTDDDSQCRACHGSPARPIWGSYDDWQGAFAGTTDQRLTDGQASFLVDLKKTQSASDRFFTLDLPAAGALAQRSFSLPARRYPYADTVFNFELGARMAEGLFARIAAHPDYARRRWSVLAGAWCDDRAVTIDALAKLGLDERNDLDVGHVVTEAKTGVDWDQGSTSLLDMVRFLVWDEALGASASLRDATATVDPKRQHLHEVWFDLRGEARRAFLKDTFDLASDDLRPQELIVPVKGALCQAIADERAAAGSN